jgi:23S rRNA pseudouridine955/2504/2580 synthase
MSWVKMSKKNSTGGVRTETVAADNDGQRLDNFISARLKGVPRSLVYRLIRTGQVRINGKRSKPASRIAEGDLVRIPPARVTERGEAVISERVIDSIKPCILHADDDMLVVDKPSGMAVHAGSGLPWGVIDVLRRLFPGEMLELAHRLDRETSGCLVLARNGASLRHLSGLFRDGQVDKRYLCLLDGVLPEALVEVDAPLARVHTGQERQVKVSPEGKPAQTNFRLLEGYSAASYAEAELLTGRTHQIRVHALHMGMPLAGDRRYSKRESVKRWRGLGLRRIFLHAHSMAFDGPAGEPVSFSAPLPDELRTVLDGLR